MSDSDKNSEKDIVSQNHPVAKKKSQEKTPTKSESQSIIINFYSGNCVQKTDKLIQTEPSEDSELSEISADVPEVSTEKKKYSSTTANPHHRSQPKSDSKPEAKRSVTPLKKTSRLMSDDRREEKSMDSRGRPIKGSARVASDLERKRLEVELKAAEEIARLKQSIIEKRLALELATIQDGAEYPVKMHNPTPQVELRALEEFAMRKQSLIETNLAQELETLEYQNRVQPAPRPSPPSPPSPPQKPPAPSPPKLGAFKTESSSSVMNSMRGLGMLDKKLNLDRRFSGHSGLRSPSPINFLAHNDIRYPENRPKKEEKPGNYPSQPDSEYQSSKEQSHGRARMAWKFAVAKIKKKMKSKSSNEDWEK